LNPPVRNVSKLSFLPPRPMSLVSSFPVWPVTLVIPLIPAAAL
jgi:hypothetical protein